MTDLRLSDCAFSDLYLSVAEDGKDGARDLSVPGGRKSRGISALPEKARRDVADLRRRLCEAFARAPGRREMQIVHDGIAYRAALIGSFDIAPGDTRESGAGQAWCLRRVEPEIPRLQDIGLDTVTTHFLAEMRRRRGLILICGGFGCGKTTTAYSLLRDWVVTTGEVGVTIEDPPEFVFPEHLEKGLVYQSEVVDDRFGDAIHHARRWAPRYMLLGEIRSPMAAREALRIAQSGPLVVATIHANNPIEAIMSISSFAADVMSRDLAYAMTAKAVLTVLEQDLDRGRIRHRRLDIAEPEHFGLRTKISGGRFAMMEDDMATQDIRRDVARRRE